MGFEMGVHGREEWPSLEKDREESMAALNEIGGDDPRSIGMLSASGAGSENHGCNVLESGWL